ncbi:MAG: sulfotransferase family 2 domain-containing protein [Parasphingorhabdus sp.]
MIVSTDKNFIYARVPKTASTSLSSALEPHRRVEDRHWIGKLGRFVAPKLVHPKVVDFRAHSHWPLLAAKHIMGQEFFDGAFKFAVVRHPVDWCYSYYQHLMRSTDNSDFVAIYSDLYENPSFENFLLRLQEHPVPPQVAMMIGEKGEIAADKIIRMENLDEELGEVEEKLGFKIELGELNRGRYAKNIEHGERALQLIYKAFAIDFEIFGYDQKSPGQKLSLDTSRQLQAISDKLVSISPLVFSPWEPWSNQM